MPSGAMAVRDGSPASCCRHEERWNVASVVECAHGESGEPEDVTDAKLDELSVAHFDVDGADFDLDDRVLPVVRLIGRLGSDIEHSNADRDAASAARAEQVDRSLIVVEMGHRVTCSRGVVGRPNAANTSAPKVVISTSVAASKRSTSNVIASKSVCPGRRMSIRPAAGAEDVADEIGDRVASFESCELGGHAEPNVGSEERDHRVGVRSGVGVRVALQHRLLLDGCGWTGVHARGPDWPSSWSRARPRCSALFTAAMLPSRVSAISDGDQPRTSRRITAARGRGGRCWMATRKPSAIVSWATTPSAGSAPNSAERVMRSSGNGCSHGTSSSDGSLALPVLLRGDVAGGL